MLVDVLEEMAWAGYRRGSVPLYPYVAIVGRLWRVNDVFRCVP